MSDQGLITAVAESANSNVDAKLAALMESKKQSLSKVNDDIYIAPQVDEQSIREYAKAGIKSLMNLRFKEEAGFEEYKDLMLELGIAYYHAPLNMMKLNEAQVDQVTGMVDHAPKPMVVHCRTAKRAAVVGLVHEHTRQGKHPKHIDDKAKDVGFACEDFPAVREFMQSYVAGKIRRAMSLTSITRVSDRLFVGPQVTEEQLKELAAQGLKSVLNLRDMSEVGQLGMGVLAREKEIVESLGMKYANIPTKAGQAPTAAQIAEVQATLAALPPPVLLHCRTRKRSSHVLAASGQHVPCVECLPHKDTSTCTYVVWDAATSKAAVIDSVTDYNQASGKVDYTHANKVIKFIEDHKLDCEYILETHAHADHLTGAVYLKKKLNASVAMGSRIEQVQKTFAPIYNMKDVNGSLHWDRLFNDGDTFNIGELEVKVMFTPGHTPACVSYIIADAVFVGDTLFHPDIGSARCDFPGGSAEQMYDSCQKLLALPPSTRVFLCHDYPGDRRPFTWEVTVAEQKATNKMLKDGTSKEEYVKLREARDATLSVPRLLYPSLQVNITGGMLPKPEDNNRRYIKIPLEVTED